MKKFKIILVLLVVSISLFVLCSCSDHIKYSMGTEIDKDLLDKLEQMITSAPDTSESQEIYQITDADVLFWSESGSKFHLYNDCQAFAQSDPSNVLYGDYLHAISDGHDEACRFCLKRANASDAEYVGETAVETSHGMGTEADKTSAKPYAVLEITNDYILYWTKSGSKLHLSKSCQSFSKTDETDIISGSYSLANSRGKIEFCKFCIKSMNIDEVVFVGSLSTEPSPDVSESKEPITESTTASFDHTTCFYWTKSGSKLHFYLDCGSLSKTSPENLLYGTYSDAEKANKTSVCSFCLKRSGLKEDEFPNFPY